MQDSLLALSWQVRMLAVYFSENKKLSRSEGVESLPAQFVWADLFHPTREEEVLVERKILTDVPTREEMQEIEISSRLYREGDALFMTAALLFNTDKDVPDIMPITFILAKHSLVTIRYSDPKSFQVFSHRVQRSTEFPIGELALLGLLETFVDRLADILEQVASEIDAVSRDIFQNQKGGQPDKKQDYKSLLLKIGQRADLNSKSRESLVSLGRLVSFLSFNLDPAKTTDHDLKGRIKTLNQDITALTDHASFLSNKINFLLDASLGLISIEQNAIIKIFSVAAVVFLPPTLVASAYGMNFKHMPELEWLYGYPFAIGLMVLSAVVPYVFFKARGWL